MSGKLQTIAQERGLGVGRNSSVNHQLQGQNGLGPGRGQFKEGDNAGEEQH